MTVEVNTQRREFLVSSATTAAALIVTGSLVGCGTDADPFPVPPAFSYGVASGDPLNDRVILWTYAKAPDNVRSVPLTWQVALDQNFASIISTGIIDATEASGFTAKVDATGLTAGASYFYRFLGPRDTASPVGKTRTLPVASVATLKFAVFSCSLYSEGFFNAYDDALKTDAQYALHLGDYIYEYGSGPTQYGNIDAVALGRVVTPANDIVSLSDYRARYALYRSDANVRALHAAMPWITIWDDHEFTNNAYLNGAENHKPATQGDWATRKNIAAKVYHEWMPIRTDNSNLLKIYRSFDFGSLFSLHMLDTRIEGRDQQYDNFGDADGGFGRYIAGITPNASGVLPDASRRMISATQQSWLASQMSASKATWQFLGNQDIMGKMWIPVSVTQNFSTGNLAGFAAATQAYLAAKATRAAAGSAALTPTQAALLDASENPRLPYNLDSWDGYPVDRERVLQSVKALNKKLVVLSGDSHNGWFTNLATLSGEKIGVEFAGTSVTSTGFESVGLATVGSSLDGSALVPQLGTAAIGAGLGLIDDLAYADTLKRGYLLMTVTANDVKGEYVYVSTVKSTTYTRSVGRTITVDTSGKTTFA